MGSSATFPAITLVCGQARASLLIPDILSAASPTFFSSRSLRYPSTRIASLNPVPRSTTLHFSRSAMAELSLEKKKRVLIFEGEEEIAVSVADYVSNLSEKYSRERGVFTVVLSGGSLIKSLRKLVEPPYIDSVDWAKWHVFWVDERVVPKDHADSNYKLAYDGFLSKVPIPLGQTYAINDALPTEGAADDYELCLKHLVSRGVLQLSKESATGSPRFDLMLLGMGPDGHIASLFPGHRLLREDHRWVTFLKDSPKPPPERITFTLPVINSSAEVALVVTGDGKAGAVLKALGSEHLISNDGEVLPVEMVEPQEGELTWFIDKAAASKLQGEKASL